MTKNYSIINLFIILTLYSFNLRAQELIPLKLGNFWKYEQTTMESGAIVATDTITNTVKDKRTLNGKEWFIMNEFGDDFIVRNVEGGQLEIDTFSVNNEGYFKEIMMFKKPDSLKNLSYTAFGTNQIRVNKEPTEITTTLGNFKSFKYTITTKGVANKKIETFITPGIGIVFHNWVIDKKQITSKLIEYKIE